MTKDVFEKYRALLKINDKLTQLHWIVAQVAGENDLHTMHNLILNGFMQIAEVPGCYFILLRENGEPGAIVKRLINNTPFGSCVAYQNIIENIGSIGNVQLTLPNPVFCENCLEQCGLSVIQVVTLNGKQGNPLGVFIAPHHNKPSSTDEANMILELFTIQVSLALENAMLNKKFESLSITDALTELYNHRYFAERLSKEMDLCNIMHKQMCLIMLDVDNFKGYNDSYGHPAGDIVLKTISKVFSQVTRVKDIVARYGGEEFALILPDTTLQDAMVVAERLRQAIERTEFAYRRVTASLGVAHCPIHTNNAKGLLDMADRALYLAKSSGRNKVVVASDVKNE